MFRRGTMVLWAFCFVCSCAAVVSATTYTFYDLGVAGESQSKSYGINSNNVVVGYNNYNNGVYSGYHASVFNYNGSLTQTWLSPISGTTAIAWAINSNGVLTGLSSSPNQAYYENANGSGGPIGLYSNFNPAPSSGSRGLAINASGQVAGYASYAGSAQGFFWDGNPSDNVTELNTMTGATNTTMYGINNAGLVAGYALGTWTSPQPVGTYDAAITWQNGVYTNLDAAICNTLSPGSSSGSEALGVNNSGEIVGYFDPGSSDPFGEPFLYKNASNIVDLGNLGGVGTHAEAISDNGYVVGYSTTAGGAQHAFLWSPSTNNGTSGTMIDLNSLGITLPSGYYFYDADAINNAGSIAGTLFNGTTYQAFALLAPLPTPEPSTLLLAAAGMVGLLAYAWRKRK